MNLNLRALVAGASAFIAFCLGYALPIFVGLPLLYYDPVGRSFSFSRRAIALPMGYYGQALYGIGGALIGALAASLIFRWSVPKDKEPAVVALWAAWTMTAGGLVMIYFAWGNWP